MGIYWKTTLYHGRLLSPLAFERLQKTPKLDSSFVSKVCKDRWILHAPKTHLVLGSLDPVIDDQEKAARLVSQAEVDKLLARRPQLGAEWRLPKAAELSTLEELVVIAADDSSAKPGTYICESQWSTLEAGTDDLYLTYNLHVM